MLNEYNQSCEHRLWLFARVWERLAIKMCFDSLGFQRVTIDSAWYYHFRTANEKKEGWLQVQRKFDVFEFTIIFGIVLATAWWSIVYIWTHFNNFSHFSAVPFATWVISSQQT